LDNNEGVASYAGARIETMNRASACVTMLVASYAGARIETSRWQPSMWPM